MSNLLHVFDPLSILILKIMGIPFVGPQQPAFEVVRYSVLAILSLIGVVLRFIVVRIFYIRRLWDKRCKVEGYWIEKIERNDRNFCTIIRIKFDNLWRRTYSIYGQTFDFGAAQGLDEDEKVPVYASFRSGALHFEIEDEICLTFHYLSKIYESPPQIGLGIAQYSFHAEDKDSGHGWFVGVVDGSNDLKQDISLDYFSIERINFGLWLKTAWRNHRLFSTIFRWRKHLARQAYDAMMARRAMHPPAITEARDGAEKRIRDPEHE